MMMARADFLIRRHPRTASAAVAALLAGGTAAAVAVAPLDQIETPTPAQQLVTQALEPERLQSQVSALELGELTLNRNDTTRRGDTADSMLRRLGADDPAAATFLRKHVVARRILDGQAGKLVQIQLKSTPAGRLVESLMVKGPTADKAERNTHFERITVERIGTDFIAHSRIEPMKKEVRMASGTIATTLFAAADDANLPEEVTGQIGEIFDNDIDIRSELRRGDTFGVIYEGLTADGDTAPWANDTGRVLAVRLINKGKSHEAIWYQNGSHGGTYYNANGQTKQRALLSSPMQYSRVTSDFGMRFHPLKHEWRAHNGVDYGAPTGTPVRAVGQAIVKFAGVQNGYGNVIVLQHPKDRETTYAHLSRMDVRVGEKVAQGAVIGAVGATGWATGPHLHFEFKVGGRVVNPIEVARASDNVVLTGEERRQFARATQTTLEQLNTIDVRPIQMAQKRSGIGSRQTAQADVR